MVAALPPERFLAGEDGCGLPLDDVELRLAPGQAVAVRTARLSPGWLDPAGLQPFDDADGWWCSGDGGQLTPTGLVLLGRRDGAVLSGGVTVYPEEVEAALAPVAGVGALLVLGVPDPDWGERLVALVRPTDGEAPEPLLAALVAAAAALPAPQRPKQWLPCPALAPNGRGKWERQHWRRWALERLNGSR
jgi:O-succinylbenzoic acid--CoA ligase